MIRNALLILVLLFLYSCRGNKIEYSPFNQKKPVIESDVEYSFLVGGHLYGKQNTSYYPANTLTVSISDINKSDASFFVGLGDIVRQPDTIHLSFFKSLFTDNLRMPFYNAVGNHDVKDRKYYESVFGKTYFYFIQKNDLFIFLDTELDSAEISGDQLLFLKKTLNLYEERMDKGNVFIFMHKLIWNDLPGFEVLKAHSNQEYTWMDSTYFETMLLPLFNKIQRPLYIFSGDIGTPHSFSLFHSKDAKNDIMYIANGLGDTPDDALIRVIVGNSKSVRFDILPLTETRFNKLEDYNIDYWNDRFAAATKNYNKYLVLFLVAALFIITLLLFRKKY